MKKLKQIIFFITFLFIVMICNSVNAASDFDLEHLEFNVKLNSDGSMDVTETWNIDINGETNTLFKTFEIDNTKYSGIENITVSDVTDGNVVNFEQINELMNHVTTNCYYGMINDDGYFEIAWGINKSSGRRTYNISYTVENVIAKYNDCVELYWQFIGNYSEKNSDNVTGTITLPKKVEVLDNIRVWTHGPLNGEIYATANDTVTFKISPYIADTFIEVRVAILETEMFNAINKTYNNDQLQNIIDEETVWANEANERRESIKRKQEEREINKQKIKQIGEVASVGIAVLFGWLTSKNLKKIKETPKLEPTTKLDYFREVPNEEKANPANASFLYYFNKASVLTVMPKVLSATMLNLALKKYIEFEVDTNKKKNEQVLVKIIGREDSQLRESEKEIYNLLRKIGTTFTMKEFEKYAQKHNNSFLNTLNRISEKAEKENIEDKNYDKKLRQTHDNYMAIGFIVFFILAVVAVVWLAGLEQGFIPVIIATVPAVIYALTCFDIAGRIPGLSQKGIDEKEQWEGLKKYMEDFSMLDEREVPDLVLWEKYLVYATAFGIADKVLKQLKVKYPEFSDDTYLSNSTYFYLMAHTDFNKSFVNTVSTSMQKAYESSVASSASSSGGGFGGGFSGGGGGGRWWRSVWEDVENVRKQEEK